MKKSIMFAMLGLGATVLASVITVQAGWLPRGWGSEDAPDAALGAEQVLTRDTATSKVAQRAIWDAGNLLLTDGSTTNPILMSNQVAALIQNLAASGYMQYGSHSATGATKTVTFNPTFTNTPKVVATIAASPQDQVLTIEVLSVGSSSFTYKIRNTGGDEARAIPINWVALAGGALPVISNTQSGVQWDSPVTSSLVPDTANTYNLGSEEKPFGSLYLSGDTIYMNGEPVITWNDQANAWQFGGQDDSAQFKNLKAENFEVENLFFTTTVADHVPANWSYETWWDAGPLKTHRTGIPMYSVFDTENLSKGGFAKMQELSLSKNVLGVFPDGFPDPYYLWPKLRDGLQWVPPTGEPTEQVPAIIEQVAALTAYTDNIAWLVNALQNQFQDVDSEFSEQLGMISAMQEAIPDFNVEVFQAQIASLRYGEEDLTSEDLQALHDEILELKQAGQASSAAEAIANGTEYTSRISALEKRIALNESRKALAEVNEKTKSWLAAALNRNTKDSQERHTTEDGRENALGLMTAEANIEWLLENQDKMVEQIEEILEKSGAYRAMSDDAKTELRTTIVNLITKSDSTKLIDVIAAKMGDRFERRAPSFGFIELARDRGLLVDGYVYLEGQAIHVNGVSEITESSPHAYWLEINVVTKQVTLQSGGSCNQTGTDQVEVWPLCEIEWVDGKIDGWATFWEGDVHVTRF